MLLSSAWLDTRSEHYLFAKPGCLDSHHSLSFTPHLSFLSNQSDPEWYELHIAVKDYCFGRTDRLVGVTVLSLAHALDLGATPMRLPLGRRLHLNETGWTVLRILSQRVKSDEIARDFVKAKSECRPSPEQESAGMQDGI
ncbi:unnamed protein product [Protopolystoma xenopodis]|uniref:C2 domain-containing protein n=1 Tax=Protopolystoma xenopodis TaxID=117903 RepID=A0A3S5CNH7_9PLAT|nr:unnamed protein product [Protopolystoma xenopodis]